jgi:hypothetical protein
MVADGSTKSSKADCTSCTNVVRDTSSRLIATGEFWYVEKEIVRQWLEEEKRRDEAQ